MLLIANISFSMSLDPQSRNRITGAFNNGTKKHIARTIQSVIEVGNRVGNNDNNQLIKELHVFLGILNDNNVEELDCLPLFWNLLEDLLKEIQSVGLTLNSADEPAWNGGDFEASLELVDYYQEQEKLQLDLYLQLVANLIQNATNIEFMTSLAEDQVLRFINSHKKLNQEELRYVKTWFFLLYAYNVLREMK
jgi:hypothetical protein